MQDDAFFHSPDTSPSPSPPHQLPTDKHAQREGIDLYIASEHSFAVIKRSPSSTNVSSPKDEKKVTVNGRTYDCTGIRISNISDEVRFGMRLYAMLSFSAFFLSFEENRKKPPNSTKKSTCKAEARLGAPKGINMKGFVH